jgi:lysophospholipase L1-like esterase
LLYKFTLIAIALFYTRVGYAVDLSGTSVVIFGDSVASGAASHPAIEYSGDVLWEVLNGEVDVTAKAGDVPFLNGLELERPRIIYLSESEIANHPLESTTTLLTQSISSIFLNTEEYSWGYQVGRKLGAPGSKIFFASTNGAQSADFLKQVQRFLTVSAGQLPKYIFVMFTGNDLCSIYGMGMTNADLYYSNIEAGLNLITEMPPHPEGTNIVLAGILPVTQVYQSQSILDHKVKAHGKEVTCRELRESKFLRPEGVQPKYAVTALFSQIFPPNPSLMCPSLFAEDKVMKSQISDVATTAGLYRDALDRLANAYRKKVSGFNVSYLKDLSSIKLEGKDIAQDCFHLSIEGQSKVAEKIFGAIK